MLSSSLTPASSSADWVSDEIAARDIDGNAVDLDGYLIEIEVRDRYNTLVLSGSTSSGIVTVTDDLLSWRFPASSMRALQADPHSVYIRLTDNATGDVEQLLVGNVDVYEGGFR